MESSPRTLKRWTTLWVQTEPSQKPQQGYFHPDGGRLRVNPRRQTKWTSPPTSYSRGTHQIDAGRKVFPVPRAGTSIKGMSKEERTKGKTKLLHSTDHDHCNDLGSPNSRNERGTTRLL